MGTKVGYEQWLVILPKYVVETAGFAAFLHHIHRYTGLRYHGREVEGTLHSINHTEEEEEEDQEGGRTLLLLNVDMVINATLLSSIVIISVRIPVPPDPTYTLLGALPLSTVYAALLLCCTEYLFFPSASYHWSQKSPPKGPSPSLIAMRIHLNLLMSAAIVGRSVNCVHAY